MAMQQRTQNLWGEDGNLTSLDLLPWGLRENRI